MDDEDHSVNDSSSRSSTSLPPVSTGIVMFSLPDTSSDEEEDEGVVNDDVVKNSADQDDVFETPPEYNAVSTSQDKTPVLDLSRYQDDDDDRQVGDLGEGLDILAATGDLADLGFPEEADEVRFSKRDLSSERTVSDPMSKKSRHDLGKSGEELEKSDEELETEPISLSNAGSGSEKTIEIGDEEEDAKSDEESSKNRSLEEETEPVTDQNGSVSESLSEERSSGIDYGEMEMASKVDPLVMPVSFCPQDESNGCSLLDLLKLVKEKSDVDYNGADKSSFLEIAKRRGMTFPPL